MFCYHPTLLKKAGFASSEFSKVLLSILPLSVSFLVTNDTKSHQILGRVITQTAARLNVMDLKTLDAAARLATPAVPLQDFTAKLTVGICI
jgi:hypothetical protein